MTHTVFVDTETTGLYPEKGHEVWEIAIIVQDHPVKRFNGEWVFHVQPRNLEQADPYALKLSRFYERSLTYFIYGMKPKLDQGVERREVYIDAPYLPNTWEKAVDEEEYTSTYDVARLISHLVRGAHLVGAVPDFDVRFLKAFCEYHGERFDPHYHLIDVEVLAVGWLSHKLRAGIWRADVPGPNDPRTKIREALTLPYNSDTLSTLVGVDPPTDERHTALGDARWAKQLYEAIIGQDQ